MTPAPFVSVVIPARNERGRIEACLRAVLAQDYPAGRYEVIVADGMSDDGTREILSRIARADARVRLIDNPGRIVPTAMNRAIAAAAGEIIVRVDGHTEIHPDYVTRCVQTLARTGADGAGGTMTPVAEGAFGGAVALALSTPFGVGNSAFHYARREREADCVYLGAYHKQTFRRFGGYDEDLARNEDDELNYRIRSRGGRIVLDPAIRSSYHPRATPASLFRQYFQYGRWKPRVMARVPSMISLRHVVPSAFVLALVSLALLSVALPELAPAPAAVLAGHALLAFAFALCRARGAGPLSIALAPAATLIVHVAYGVGVLAGLPALLADSRPAPAEAESARRRA